MVRIKGFFSWNGTIAVLIGVLAAVLLTATAPSIGLTWDEPAYIAASESYAHWFGVLAQNPTQAFQPVTIDHYWGPNHEHPPLDKLWSGIVWEASRHFTDDLTAHRLGNILLASALVALLFLWLAQAYGKGAGFFGAAALLLMPRFFFHAHLAALDMPVAAAIFFVTYLFWWSRDRREWWWGVVLGVAWGLAEAVKLNATFLPIALAAWALLFRRQWRMLLRFALMGFTAPLTFLFSWVWLYHHTLERILAYIKFQVHHFKIGAWYLGHFYVQPPWHYVLVMTWAVVPLMVMLLAFAGMARTFLGKEERSTGALLLISMAVPLLVFASGRALAYDDDRLFMPSMPFLAALAGAGFGWLLGGIHRAAGNMERIPYFAPLSILLGIMLLLPQSLEAASLYPHLLSYYSEGVGGLYGASKLGLETTYWCESYEAALPYINAHAQAGDRVWIEPCNLDVMTYYQMHGRLRRDVKIVTTAATTYHSFFGAQAPKLYYGDFTSADWLILQNRQSQYGFWGPENPPVLRYVRGLGKPVYEVSYQGVPIMELYHASKP